MEYFPKIVVSEVHGIQLMIEYYYAEDDFQDTIGFCINEINIKYLFHTQPDIDDYIFEKLYTNTESKTKQLGKYLLNCNLEQYKIMTEIEKQFINRKYYFLMNDNTNIRNMCDGHTRQELELLFDLPNIIDELTKNDLFSACDSINEVGRIELYNLIIKKFQKNLNGSKKTCYDYCRLIDDVDKYICRNQFNPKELRELDVVELDVVKKLSKLNCEQKTLIKSVFRIQQIKNERLFEDNQIKNFKRQQINLKKEYGDIYENVKNKYLFEQCNKKFMKIIKDNTWVTENIEESYLFDGKNE